MSGYGDPGAERDDAYAVAGRTGGRLPQTDDPALAKEIDAYVAAHPGVSRSEALNFVLRNRRDAKAQKVLIDCLASAIEERGDDCIELIELNISQFNKWVCDQDEGDNGIKIRKRAA